MLNIDQEREFISQLMSAGKLILPCRNFVFPEWNSLRLDDARDARNISVQELFAKLGIPKDRLAEIYEQRDVQTRNPLRKALERLKIVKPKRAFSGSFTEDGKQVLANILGKTIETYYSPQQFCYDPRTRQVFVPQSEV